MKNAPANILINSTLAFISAFIITTFLHELGHYVSYALLGADPTLYHNFVRTDGQGITKAVRIISALAGPVVSLVQGILFSMVVAGGNRNNGTHLLFLWLSLLGFVNFFGYLVMTPISTIGDTGKVAQLLGVAYWIQLLVAAVGFVALLWTISRVARHFADFIPAQAEAGAKPGYVYKFMFFPIILGSLVNSVLAFPVVAILSVIYPATSPYVIMSAFPMILKSENVYQTKSDCEKRIVPLLVLLALGAVALNRFLTLGIG